jgi:hypothetical protein
LVEQDGRSRGGSQLHRSAHMVNVSMSDDDLLDMKIVFADQFENVLHVITGINDDGLARGLISNDGAVALQRADGNDFVDHAGIELPEAV